MENQIDQLLSKKNAAILELEAQVQNLQHQLGRAQHKNEELQHTVEVLESSRLAASGGGAGDGAAMETEIKALNETVDSLSHQLTQALEELEELKSQ